MYQMTVVMCRSKGGERREVRFVRTVLDDNIPVNAYRLFLIVVVLLVLSFGTSLVG
jgi:hypothetical protein